MQVAVQSPGISAEAAATAVQAAVTHAEAKGWKINAAVVDRGGNLMAFLRMPGAFIHSIDAQAHCLRQSVIATFTGGALTIAVWGAILFDKMS